MTTPRYRGWCFLALALSSSLCASGCSDGDDTHLANLGRCGREVEACGGQVVAAFICRDVPGACHLNGKPKRCGEVCSIPPGSTLTIDLQQGIVPPRMQTLDFVPEESRSSAEVLRDFDVSIDGIAAVPDGRSMEFVFPDHRGPLGLLEITNKQEIVGENDNPNIVLDDGPCVDAVFDKPECK